MRVIAEFPDVSPGGPVPSPATETRERSAPPGRGEFVLPSRSRSRSTGGKKSVFPTWSVVTLAVVAAVVWTFVAIGERPGINGRRAAPRLAAEPPPSTVPSGTNTR